MECLEPSVLLECKEGPFIEHEVDGILEIKNKVQTIDEKDIIPAWFLCQRSVRTCCGTERGI
jgi:hypothetical protein